MKSLSFYKQVWNLMLGLSYHKPFIIWLSKTFISPFAGIFFFFWWSKINALSIKRQNMNTRLMLWIVYPLLLVKDDSFKVSDYHYSESLKSWHSFFSGKRFTCSNIKQSWPRCSLCLQSTVTNSFNFAKLLLKSNCVRTLIDFLPNL